MSDTLTAVILAGGIGKRFSPLTTDKLLFPFFGKSFFEHAVATTLPPQVTNVVVITNSINRDVVASMKFPVPHMVVVQKQPLGMADALLSAASELKGALLIMIADDFLDPALYELVVAEATSSRAFGVIPGWKTPTYFPGGYLALADTVITNIVEKPEVGKTPSPYVNVSGHYIKDSDVLLAEISRTTSEQDDRYEKALTSLMKHEEFRMVPYEGTFGSLKYPWDVLGAMDFFFHNKFRAYKGKRVVIKENVTIEGQVYIGDGVKIFENTKIVGPCYIGQGTIIGNNNIIRDSHIGAGCVTGFSTDITRSYIGDNCWFHTNYIGDSVLEGNISMGSGGVLANLRLDDGVISSRVREEKVSTGKNKLGAIIGKNVRIGVNASIMPGIKVGSGSFVGSGVILDRDLPENVYAVASGGYAVKPNTGAAASSRDAFKTKL